MAEKECPDCEQEIDLGDVSIPKVTEFVSISCSDCGNSFQVSLLRIALREKISERLQKN